VAEMSKRVDRTYSSGVCSGFTPDSLLINLIQVGSIEPMRREDRHLIPGTYAIIKKRVIAEPGA